MKVVVVEPEKPAYVKEIDGTLESMQNIVGGYIEALYPFEDEVALVCNEEGKLSDDCQLNRIVYAPNGSVIDIIAGTFFLAGLSEDDFDSLSDELVEKYLKMYETPDTLRDFYDVIYSNKE